MYAGRLNRRVTIKSRTETSDSQGGYTTTWSTLASVWAEIVPISAREAFHRQGLQPGTTHRFKIRYRSDVDTTQQIYLGDRVFYIRGIQNLDERDRWLQLLCEEAA